MHSPAQDLALSSFTVREATVPLSLAARLRLAAERFGELVAEWRVRIRTRDQLARMSERDWAVGDHGIARWQAEAELRKPFWIN